MEYIVIRANSCAEGVQDFDFCMSHMAVGYFPVCAFYVDKWQYLISGPGGEM